MRNGSGGEAEAIPELTIGRLRRLGGHIPPEELSEIWVFPPLADFDGSDEFHLFTRRMTEGVYRVCAAEFSNGDEPRVTVYGAVPEARVQRLVTGFRRRLGDRNAPLYLPILGSVERWRLVVGAEVDDDAGTDAAGAEVETPDEVMIA